MLAFKQERGAEIPVQTEKGDERVKVINPDEISLHPWRSLFPRQKYKRGQINAANLSREIFPLVEVAVKWREDGK